MAITDTYRRLALPLYLPSLLLAVAHQGLLILLPVYLLELDHGPAVAALVMGLRGIGMFLVALPAGVLVGQWGDKPVMLLALLVLGLSSIAFVVSPDLRVLAPLAVCNGIGIGAWLLARLSYITDGVALVERGRAIAVVAGIQRVGALLGPVLAGLLAKHISFEAAFVASGILILAAALLVLAKSENVRPDSVPHGPHLDRLRNLAVAHRGILATAGVSSLILMLLRAARHLLIPLFGAAIGLDVAAIGLIYSLSSAIDLSLFYPAGLVMDRYGRKWAGVPGTALLAIALGLLPLAQGFYALLAVACLAGLANGWATGVVMTLGSDLAPVGQRGEFLGLWRLLIDSSQAGAPFLIGALIQVASLGAGALVLCVIGLGGAAVMSLFVKETLRRDPLAP